MKYIPIGTITKPHGLKGNLHVKSDTDFKEARYKIGQTLYLHKAGKRTKVTVENHFEKKPLDVLKFEEFDDISAVEPYRGATLEIEASKRGTLADDEFYFDDLVGLAVYVRDEHKGDITDVFELPQGAALRVKLKNGKTKLVPFLKVYVDAVDMDQGIVKIHDIEGLL